jgi:hypothetical protein
MDLSNVRELSFSEHGKIKFKADDKVRGEADILLSDPRDVKVLAEFLVDVLAQMQAGTDPETAGYLRIA